MSTESSPPDDSIVGSIGPVDPFEELAARKEVERQLQEPQPREVENWLKGFNFYSSECEAPSIYLLWAALSAISGVTRRKVWTRKGGYFRIYPNIYALLVGPPGVGKGMAMRMTKPLLKEVGVPFATASGSREAIIRQMNSNMDEDRSAIMIYSEEFGSLFNTSKDSMIGFLYDLWDCPDDWSHDTVGSGDIAVDNAFLTMVAGTTPKWMAINFGDDFIDTGFAARAVVVYAQKKRFLRAFPDVTPEMRAMEESLKRDLARIGDLEGEMFWTPGAVKWFKHWYLNVFPHENPNYRILNFHNRKELHIIKVACLISLATGDDMRITEEHFEVAHGIIEQVVDVMPQAYDSVGSNPLHFHTRRVARELKERGSIPVHAFIEENDHALDSRQRREVTAILRRLGWLAIRGNDMIWAGGDAEP